VTVLRVIAIDGPAGAGKSTVARALARRLGLEYLDTGAMYRAVTWAALDRGVDPGDTDGVAALAPGLAIDVGEGGVFVDGTEVTDAIRTPEVTRSVSAVAANSAVRSELRGRQRAWGEARRGGVIEGRDIGSVVFPDAVLKVHLTASPRVRAERRVAEAGGHVHEIEAAIAARDHHDRNRVDGPLAETPDTVVVDTTGLDVGAVLDVVVDLLERAEAQA
jgi:cytidylate kinase